MAVPYHQSSRNWMLPVKVALISTGVLCTALILKLSLPVVTDFAFCELPSIWSFLISWLKPPYLYVVINCIIVTIVATSKLQQNSNAAPPPQTVVHLPSPDKVLPDYAASVFDNVVPNNDGPVAEPAQFSYSSDGLKVHAYEESVPMVPEKIVTPSEFSYAYDATDFTKSSVRVYEQSAPPVPETKTMTSTAAMKADPKVKDIEADVAASESFRSPLRSTREFPLPSIEKPPVSGRFSHRRAFWFSPIFKSGSVLSSQPKMTKPPPVAA